LPEKATFSLYPLFDQYWFIKPIAKGREMHSFLFQVIYNLNWS